MNCQERPIYSLTYNQVGPRRFKLTVPVANAPTQRTLVAHYGLDPRTLLDARFTAVIGKSAFYH